MFLMDNNMMPPNNVLAQSIRWSAERVAANSLDDLTSMGTNHCRVNSVQTSVFCILLFAGKA